MAGSADIAGNTDFAVVRYNTNGSLDTSFDADGKVTTAVGAGSDTGLQRGRADGRHDPGGGQFSNGSRELRPRPLQRRRQPGHALRPDQHTRRYANLRENGAAVVLDSNVQVFDDELTAADNFSGATLTLVRNGGANAQDVFSATGTLSPLTQGGNLVVGGTTIGTVTTNSSGTLVLTFNGNATNALVNSAMQQIAYSNSSDEPPASVQIDWTFNDGNTGDQGTGGAKQCTGSVTVTIVAVNDAPVLDNSGTMTLTTITEDQTTNSGDLVSAIIASAGGDRITDVGRRRRRRASPSPA